MTARTPVCALVLAGGTGRRAGYRDKGLIHLQGRPLIAHVIERLRPQVDDILISCNRNVSEYQRFGVRTITDLRPDYQGPLAGLEAAIPHVSTGLLAVVSCDTPHLPGDLIARLAAVLVDESRRSPEISYAHDGLRPQYLSAVLRRECLASVPEFLDRGGRAVREWYASRHATYVDFADRRPCFRNYNALAYPGV